MPLVYLEVKVDGKSRRLPVEPGASVSIGRGPQNSLLLTGNNVSRQHALVTRNQQGESYVADLGSRNGTMLNGRQVTGATRLDHDDRLQIGDFELRFASEAETVAAPAGLKPPEMQATSVQITVKEITVFVLDLRDFSGLSQRLGQERLTAVMGALMNDAGTVLHEHGVYRQKYIGDAIMALWTHAGLVPEVTELRRIFEALSKVAAIAAGLQQRFALAQPVHFGIGINTGPALMGNMGSVTAADHTAMGDTVIQAFRLESATKEVGADLLIGKLTYQALMQVPELRACWTPYRVQLKGYAQTIDAYGTGLGSLPGMIALLSSAGAPIA